VASSNSVQITRNAADRSSKLDADIKFGDSKTLEDGMELKVANLAEEVSYRPSKSKISLLIYREFRVACN
jgi:hypothetical protein